GGIASVRLTALVNGSAGALTDLDLNDRDSRRDLTPLARSGSERWLEGGADALPLGLAECHAGLRFAALAMTDAEIIGGRMRVGVGHEILAGLRVHERRVGNQRTTTEHKSARDRQ